MSSRSVWTPLLSSPFSFLSFSSHYWCCTQGRTADVTSQLVSFTASAGISQEWPQQTVTTIASTVSPSSQGWSLWLLSQVTQECPQAIDPTSAQHIFHLQYATPTYWKTVVRSIYALPSVWRSSEYTSNRIRPQEIPHQWTTSVIFSLDFLSYRWLSLGKLS